MAEYYDLKQMSTGKTIAWALSLVIGIFLLAGLWSSFIIIKPGDAGVVFNILSGRLYTVDQGLTMRIPWITRVQNYPVALRTYTMVKRGEEGGMHGDDSIDLPTSDGQHIKQDISVTYNTDLEHAANVFRSFRGSPIEDIESTFVRRMIITIAQNISGKMPLTDIISVKREVIQKEVYDKLRGELGKFGFNLDTVNWGASYLPEEIEKALREKMSAQQAAQKAQYTLQEKKTLAEAEVAEAQGRAKANEIVRATLTPLILQQKSIEKWNGVLPQYLGGAVPFLQIPGAEQPKR